MEAKIELLINYFSLWFSNPVYKATTPETVVGTGWAIGEYLNLFAGMSLIIGIGISIIGVLLYSGKKGSLFWLWGLVPLIAFPTFSVIWQPSQYIPAVYGIGGGIITFAYLGVLWAWVKTHTAYEGIAKTGKHIQLLGYSFLYITALFLCLYIGQPNLPGLADQPIVSGYSIVIAFSVGWVLLSVG
ncbi:unnamed protein product, partial [marine sediment metagenome]